MMSFTWVLKEVDPVEPTQAVRHTCSGNLGIVKILRYFRSDIVKKKFWQEDGPTGQRGPVHTEAQW